VVGIANTLQIVVETTIEILSGITANWQYADNTFYTGLKFWLLSQWFLSLSGYGYYAFGGITAEINALSH